MTTYIDGEIAISLPYPYYGKHCQELNIILDNIDCRLNGESIHNEVVTVYIRPRNTVYPNGDIDPHTYWEYLSEVVDIVRRGKGDLTRVPEEITIQQAEDNYDSFSTVFDHNGEIRLCWRKWTAIPKGLK